MIWLSREPREVEIEGVKWIFKPLDAAMQARLLDKLAKIETTQDVIESAYVAFDAAYVDVTGLLDEKGREVKVERIHGASIDMHWFLGLQVADMHKLIQAIVGLGKLPEDTRKKSLSPEPSPAEQ